MPGFKKEKNIYFYKADVLRGSENGKWKPSIFMPKEAARIWLEVTDIRVERIQDISENDAQEEGCPGKLLKELIPDSIEINRYSLTPSEQFIELWDKINKLRGYGWDKNPWVWVISFKRLN